MLAMREESIRNLDPAQAADLFVLVELEAHWENLRKMAVSAAEGKALTHDLLGKQKAYESFHSKLVLYNKQYTPGYVPETLLNTPSRLGAWCRAMRDLCLKREHALPSHCPVHVLEKAYRWADRIGFRINKDAISRSTRPDTIGAVIRALEALIQWCDGLMNLATPA